jgi:hypothetical protein
MKSKWKVTSNPVGGEILYGVYRIKDTSQVDHSGNREYAGGYVESREVAQTTADKLNSAEPEEMKLLEEHECDSMKNQNTVFVNKRWQNGKARWFYEVDTGSRIIANEIKYCPYCREELPK